jgi:hypothetical protein
MTPKRSSALFAIALSLAIALVYSFGLSNQLLFDDARLTDGTIFGQYGSLWLLKVRSLSYGSFVWVQAILGEGWAKQRGFNIALHIATALALYGLVLELLKATHWDDPLRQSAGFPSTLTTSARLGVALWALEPGCRLCCGVFDTALHRHGDLVCHAGDVGVCQGVGDPQASLASAVGCLLCARRVFQRVCGHQLLAAGAALCLCPAPTSQGHRAPGGRVWLVMGGVGMALYSQYAGVIGNVFDDTSRAHMAQLEQIQPGISKNLFPLSIINQASLFFQYGLMWLLPYVGWMSIDLRPAFPLGFLSWQMLGAIAYVALLLAGLWLVWRRSNIWGLLGLSLLIPSLMFTTEFATVWLQDPLVLYRSYLWSMGVPVLLGLAVGLAGRGRRAQRFGIDRGGGGGGGTGWLEF